MAVCFCIRADRNCAKCKSEDCSSKYYASETIKPYFGWACPKCGTVLAPWKGQCDCQAYKKINNSWQ